MIKSLSVILFLFLGTIASAQVCTDYVANNMNIIGKVNNNNSGIYNVALEGDVAFVSTSLDIFAIDISDPAYPVIIGTYDKTQTGSEIAIIDGLICMASYNEELQFIDATDPTNMSLVTTLPHVAYARSVIAHGDYFYIAAGSGGLYTVDASDPANPFISSSSDPGPFIARMAIQGGNLYTVGWDDPLCTFSLADPAQPLYRSQTGGYSGSDLEIVGDYLYRSSTYANRTLLGVYQLLPGSGLPGYVRTISCDFEFRNLTSVGNFLFCSGEPFINALDLSDPENPQYVGRLIHDKPIGDMVPYGDVLLCEVEDRLLVNVDVSRPESTVPLNIWSLVDPAYDLEFHDDLYLWAAGGDGLQIWEYGEYPQTSTVALTDTLYAVKRVGDLAYLAIDEDGLQIADISNPANPILVGGVNSSSQSRDVDVYTNESGTYALLALREQDLIKYDVTDPANISFYGLNSFPGFVYAVEVVGDHLLVADTWGHLNVMDLSVFPDQPEVVAVVDLPGGAYSLQVKGNLCYVGGDSFLAVVDITDPGSPVLLGDTPTRLTLTDLAVEGTVAYGTLGGYGMVVIEVGNPADPVVRCETLTQSQPLTVAVHDDQVLIGTLESGLVFMPLQCSTSISAVDTPFLAAKQGIVAYPNPFNPRTSIRFESPRSGPVHLAVYDLAGRQVAEIIDGWLDAGFHERAWNGRDKTGRAASSGQYLVRLKTLDGVSVQKVLLAK